ncbi:MAG: hypothetical protein H6943_02860 [Zoogloeaceae bacterium]|nr:hypothetical protein [Zoogloeaceae bacterium]
MTPATARKLYGLAVVIVVICWAAIAHYGSAGHGSATLNAALGVAPIALFLAIFLWRLPSRIGILAGALAGAALLAWLWPQLQENVPLLYYLQHLGAHLALGTLFGRTLFGNGEALATRMARTIFGDQLSARKIRYTRQVTIFWACFFFGNALLSTGLFLFAPPAVWSVHANLLTWPLVGLMFATEHVWRRQVLPPEERPSLAAIINAFRRLDRRQGSAAPPP